jgi:uncharacterized cupin superfamily protein
MPPRLLTHDVLHHPLSREPLPREDVVTGSPTAGTATLDSLGATEVGLWEMSVGSARDTEVDEVFVVVAGRGTVTFEDGEVLALEAGVAVRLRAGERTTWVVDETLRKVWVA